MIVKVYMDESGTHGAKLMILSGCVGTLGQWRAFDKRWQRLLKRYGLSHHHMKDLSDTHREYKGWPRAKKVKYAAELAELIERGILFGFSIMIRREDFEQLYLAGGRDHFHFDSDYGLSFRFCLSWLPDMTYQALRRKDVEFDFILEAGHRNAGDVKRIFDQVKTTERKLGRPFRTLKFAAKVQHPGLQAADAIAYQAFNGEMRENFPVIDRPSQSTFAHDRAATRSRSPIYRLQVGEHELQQFRKLLGQ